MRGGECVVVCAWCVRGDVCVVVCAQRASALSVRLVSMHARTHARIRRTRTHKQTCIHTHSVKSC